MEYPDISSIGPLELIDRLVVITDGEEIRTTHTLTQDTRDEAELGVVRILIFVDHDPLVLLGDSRTDTVVSLDESDSTQDHVREIYK